MTCYACDNNARLGELPPREEIVVRAGWRAAHAFNTSLPGWLVLVPLRHVERFSELTNDEAEAFALLARDVSRALERELACTKTYVAIFGEQAGFEHLHAHVVPRMPDFDSATSGTFVFARLDVDEREWVPEQRRDELARALRRRLEARS